MLFLGTSGVSSSTFYRKTKLTLAETLRFVSDINEDSDFDDLDDEIVDGDYRYVPKIICKIYISLLHALWLLFFIQ